MSKTSIILCMHNIDQYSVDLVEKLVIPGLTFNGGTDKQLIIYNDNSPKTIETSDLIINYRSILENNFGDFRFRSGYPNHGFSKSYNDIVKEADGDMLFMMSSDVFLPWNSVDKLVKSSKENQAMVGPITNSAYGFQKSKILKRLTGKNYASTFNNLFFDLISNINFNLDLVMPNNSYPVSRLNRLAFAIPKELFNEVGGFDESMKNFYSDTKLSQNVKSLLNAHVFAYHHDKRSLSNRPFTRLDVKTFLQFNKDRKKYLAQGYTDTEFIKSAMTYFFGLGPSIDKDIKKYYK